MPKTNAVNSDTTAVKVSTVGLIDTSFRRGSPGGSHFNSALMPSATTIEADDGTEQREHGALGQQLADDAPASRADGGADGQLALPRHALRQQQAADVGAGDQQDQCRSPLQDLERRAQVAADASPRSSGTDANAPALVARRFFAEAHGPADWRSACACSSVTPSFSRATTQRLRAGLRRPRPVARSGTK